MAKSVKKKTTVKKVETKKSEVKKERKMINIPQGRAIYFCLELAFVYGLLLAWVIAEFLIETNYFETEVAMSNLIWMFFPVLFVVIALILFTYYLMCKSISEKK